MDGLTDGWTDRQTDGLTDGWMDGRTDEWVGGPEDRWTDGWTDGWKDGWTDRQTVKYLSPRRVVGWRQLRVLPSLGLFHLNVWNIMLHCTCILSVTTILMNMHRLTAFAGGI